MVNEALFSSKSDEWETPQKLFDELNKEFNFGWDLAASKENTKCNHYFDQAHDALAKDWSMIKSAHCLWLNPPYSDIKDWVRKAYEENLKGAKIVMLIPSRTDTRWFHEYIYKNPNVEIRFIKGRLKFSNSKNSAPFPSMLAIFRYRPHAFGI